jgi:hypothetical protein
MTDSPAGIARSCRARVADNARVSSTGSEDSREMGLGTVIGSRSSAAALGCTVTGSPKQRRTRLPRHFGEFRRCFEPATAVGNLGKEKECVAAKTI